MTTINISISASADDCVFWGPSGFRNINLTANNFIGYASSAGDAGYGGGYRFLSLNIPEGATITTAYVTLVAADNWSADTVYAYITGEKTLSPATWSTVANYQGRRGTVVSGANNDNITTAQVSWTLPHVTQNTSYNTPEIKTVIQEICDLGEVTNLALWIDDHNNRTTPSVNKLRSFYSYNTSVEKAPVLHIEYTVESTGVQATSNDTTTVTEGTGFRFSVLNTTKSDTVVITENVSLQRSTIPVSKFESIAIAESVTLSLPPKVDISVHDHIRIADFVYQNVFDGIGLTESANLSIPINAFTYDDVVITENNNLFLGQQHISTFDSVEVTDSNEQYLGQLIISAGDTVEVTEDSTLLIIDNTILASASDGIEISEETSQYLGSQYIEAHDDVDVEESNYVFVNGISVVAYEDVGIVEAAEQYFKQKYATGNDSVIISDTAILYLKQLRLIASDNVAITERINISGVGTFTPRRRTGLLMGVYP